MDSPNDSEPNDSEPGFPGPKLTLTPVFGFPVYTTVYSFSTWPNSSSTGVARPKMVTETLSRLFS